MNTNNNKNNLYKIMANSANFQLEIENTNAINENNKQSGK